MPLIFYNFYFRLIMDHNYSQKYQSLVIFIYLIIINTHQIPMNNQIKTNPMNNYDSHCLKETTIDSPFINTVIFNVLK
jgi:hypothetical protein